MSALTVKNVTASQQCAMHEHRTITKLSINLVVLLFPLNHLNLIILQLNTSRGVLVAFHPYLLICLLLSILRYLDELFNQSIGRELKTTVKAIATTSGKLPLSVTVL
jgi:hypothetical protein